MFENCLELAKYINEYQVKFINLLYINIDGSTQCETFLTKSFDVNHCSSGVKFFAANTNHDLLLKPDLATGFLNPFSSQITITFFCYLIKSNPQTKHEFCSRSYLKNTDQKLLQRFSNFHAYIEFNFDIYDDNSTKNKDFFHDILSEILETSASIGINVYSHFSTCNSRVNHSIIFSSENLLKLADNLYKLKYIVLNVIHSYGKKTSLDLMNKWQQCFKIKFSLQKNGKNFFDSTECGDFLQKICQNSELITLLSLGSNNHINLSNQFYCLQQVFEKIYLNFNLINYRANIYLALHAIFNYTIDEDEVESSDKNNLDFNCFNSKNIKQILENKPLTQNLLTEETFEQYCSKIKSILQQYH